MNRLIMYFLCVFFWNGNKGFCFAFDIPSSGPILLCVPCFCLCSIYSTENLNLSVWKIIEIPYDEIGFKFGAISDIWHIMKIAVQAWIMCMIQNCEIHTPLACSVSLPRGSMPLLFPKCSFEYFKSRDFRRTIWHHWIIIKWFGRESTPRGLRFQILMYCAGLKQ